MQKSIVISWKNLKCIFYGYVKRQGWGNIIQNDNNKQPWLWKGSTTVQREDCKLQKQGTEIAHSCQRVKIKMLPTPLKKLNNLQLIPVELI